tara:strand:- start:128 stop:232 length:105 start_codon:yes stop_codon:yes gene_type:complete
MMGAKKPTSEQLYFILGIAVGAAIHEPITVMVGF